MRRTGKFSLIFDHTPRVESTGTIVGKKEADGPLGRWFDIKSDDSYFTQKTWEQAEAIMQQTALLKALEKTGLDASSLDMVFSGDLENQCIASSFGVKALSVPFVGLYGACSTMAQSLALAGLFVESGAAGRTAAVTSSHFCTAERQYRYPLEYGGQRPPTAQWTVTGAGAAIIASDESCQNRGAPVLKAARFGVITELGIKDIGNMGAAMAPAAAEAISGFLSDTNQTPDDFDLILTGDLGELGLAMTRRILKDDGLDTVEKIKDCGCMIYDNSEKKFGCGGSGCGCSASVLNSMIYAKLCERELKSVLFVGTGALMSPVSVFQGEVIPAVAHTVQFASKS